MKIKHIKTKTQHIIYDASISEKLIEDWFSPTYLNEHGLLLSVSSGRGTVWFFRHEKYEFALKHYQRGGEIASILKDRYLWRGVERTRSMKEWKLLSNIYQKGLPAPQPFAVRIKKYPFFYSTDIITVRIKNTKNLETFLAADNLGIELWKKLGGLIKKFHTEKICHADLNTNNILIDSDHNFYLIDFDKSEIKKGENWKTKNLKRLRRSLRKSKNMNSHDIKMNFEALLEGYKKH
jgi:3-deoxy-D-manno-octulosonic acid kinase